MATLKVKNIGPIQEAELEVKKHTIFIGPQGSGKSTLAKLIALFSSANYNEFIIDILEDYNIESFIEENSLASFSTSKYKSILNSSGIDTHLLDQKQLSIASKFSLMKKESGGLDWPSETPYSTEDLMKIFYEEDIDDKRIQYLSKLFSTLLTEELSIWKSANFINKIYIPAERTLIATLSKSIWKLISSDVGLPKVITQFAANFASARSPKSEVQIPFLNVRYEYTGDSDILHYPTGKISLNHSATGYQSVVPLVVVVDNYRIRAVRRFIIEEPELNLYPTAQKDLIYALVGGLQPDIDYHDAEWVITTHSPYVLSSYNTLMLAYKVAQKNDELRAKVEKIIPSRCWINPDDFAAYYVDNGTVRSIISEKTGLISDNELDDVSEQFAAEQDQLLELNRSVPRD